MLEVLKNLAPTLIAASISLITVLITQYKSKRVTFFQTYFSKKIDAYSKFWEAIFLYEQNRSAENYAQLSSAMHTICLFAPLGIYEMVLSMTNKLAEVPKLSGDDVLNLMDLMRLDLDRCRRTKFPKIKPVDSSTRLS